LLSCPAVVAIVACEDGSMTPQAEAFDRFFEEKKFPGYGRRNDLSGLNPVIRRQFELIQETFNFALANVEKGIVGHVNTLPFHLDYVDADEKEKNAHAFCDAGYSFIAITMPLIGFLSDICLSLSKSPEIAQVLGIQHSTDDYNQFHAVMFAILIAFIVAHEHTHHIYGHVSEEDSKRLFLGITPLVYGAKFQQQVSELVADGHAIYTVLMNYIVTTNMNGSNSFYGLNADNSSLTDEQMLATVVVVVAAFLLMLPERELDEHVVYTLSHPPPPARLNSLMHEAVGWSSHNRPQLEAFLQVKFKALLGATAIAVLREKANQVWNGQTAFLKSPAGVAYVAELAKGVADFRKSMK